MCDDQNTARADDAVAPEASGNWTMVQTTFKDDNGGQQKLDCTFQQDAEKLRGQCGKDALAGKVTAEGVSWELIVQYDNHTATLHYEGRFDDQNATIRGSWSLPKHCENAAYKTGTFVLKRQ